MKESIKTVVVAIGGNGTRLAPVTTVVPKQLIPIVDKPVLQYVLEEVMSTDIKRIIFVAFKNRKTKLMMSYLKECNQKTLAKIFNKIKVQIVYVKSNTLGDAIPVRAVKKYVTDEPFLVLWSDSFALESDSRLKQLFNVYNKYREPVLSLLKIGKRETDLYAIARVKRINRTEVIVKELLEKPGPKLAPSMYAAPNGFILDKRIFPYIQRLRRNKKGELSVIDAINDYCKTNVVYGSIFDKPFFEAGNKLDVVRSILKMTLTREDLKELKGGIKDCLNFR